LRLAPRSVALTLTEEARSSGVSVLGTIFSVAVSVEVPSSVPASSRLVTTSPESRSVLIPFTLLSIITAVVSVEVATSFSVSLRLET